MFFNWLSVGPKSTKDILSDFHLYVTKISTIILSIKIFDVGEGSAYRRKSTAI